MYGDVNMTLKEFVDKYEGKYVDWDKYYGAQCVDLYDFYCKEVLGAPIHYVTGAKDIWDNYPKEHFTKIPNTPDGIPTPGSVMIWGREYGPWGHVAIVISADVNRFKVLSQNDPVDTPTQIRDYNYNYVLGWLKPLSVQISNMDSKKAIQFDRVLNYLKEKGYIADNDSNKYLDGEFLDLIMKLYDDYKSNSSRAGKWDTICNKVYGPVDSNSKNPDGVYETIKLSVKPDTARIKELEKLLAECEVKCQQQLEEIKKKILALLNTL